ncbi:hypothetical protein [Marinitenerispora sediminis]|uniref:Uncharacterized protein n=1 Tax=Marinitenerispora sediminis TaxID=1931232 RepID=A0A368TAN0_9ACTN|nr:hypothetical protein [Marinitenerispora sediminis]RCV50790.1 hypothetical protein DEF28_17160 [Marinitenerispora sediminis]RCV55033.1 hypothetical protein DEF23_14955 [Marinitenerispora sediminis]RCV62072.1 hypothetical protein DEF24_02570 [Marinitenerispora sediminis]
MMALLRSRTAMLVLVAVVTVGLVATSAVGLLNGWGPAPASQGAADSAAPAPEMEVLGAAPDGVEYTDLGQQCDTAECYRPVALTSDSVEGEQAVEAVYNHLLDQGWGRLLPQGATDPADVPLADSALTDGSVIVQGSVQPYTEGSTAGLVLAHASAPA